MPRLIDDIKRKSKEGKVVVFFDMDGTCAEYSYRPECVKNYVPNFFRNLRPLHSVLKFMKSLCSLPNVEVKILSICHFDEQEREKREWLGEFAPFLKDEDIFIIKRIKNPSDESQKNLQKANFMRDFCKNSEYIFLVDDDHPTNKAAKKTLENFTPVHISSLID